MFTYSVFSILYSFHGPPSPLAPFFPRHTLWWLSKVSIDHSIFAPPSGCPHSSDKHNVFFIYFFIRVIVIKLASSSRHSAKLATTRSTISAALFTWANFAGDWKLVGRKKCKVGEPHEENVYTYVMHQGYNWSCDRNTMSYFWGCMPKRHRCLIQHTRQTLLNPCVQWNLFITSPKGPSVSNAIGR